MAHTDFRRVASVDDLPTNGMSVVEVDGNTICIVREGDKIHAVDNRCPHMGFPLHKGSCKDGILTCHWHHARFDLVSGGTFDLFADDVRAYPVRIEGDGIYVDTTEPANQQAHHRQRLDEGLRQNFSLVIAKSLISLLDADPNPTAPFRIGLEYGVKNRADGWAPGLTVLSCMMNILPFLEPDDRPRALYHGLSFVASDTAGRAPQLEMQPLPSTDYDSDSLKRWYREFVETYNADGASRCLATAANMQVESAQLAEIVFSAATDHRFINTGHSLDFSNKAFEALDSAGWDLAGPALVSLVRLFADRGAALRMEESDQWRRPIDLVAILQNAFAALPQALDRGKGKSDSTDWRGRLTPVLLGDEPQRIADSLLQALTDGCRAEDLAACVAYAAAMRIAQFRTSNDFGDWNTVAHTFIFANAVHQAIRRTGSADLLRGVFDAAISVYTDRFLNMPPARLYEPSGASSNPDAVLSELSGLLDRIQQVDAAGSLVGRYLHSGGAPEKLMATLGKLLLREDRDFHTIQVVEAAFRQYSLIDDKKAGIPILIAAARYLAAHAPTDRTQDQTFRIAERLHKHEDLVEAA